jgi:alginate O-acetyltransferase complex protein AlgI
MNFASKSFFVFLPIVVAGYYALPTRQLKFRFLLAASWFFYMSWNPRFIWVILFTSVVDYYAGMLIESAVNERRRKWWLLVSIVTNLGFLAVFKYTNFFVTNGLTVARWTGWEAPDVSLRIILPLGISFHTFQGISYTVDVYRRKIAAVRSFVDFALFVAFFPQLVAGPIVRAIEFLPQMVKPPRATADQVMEGLHWFILGLFKKVFLADRLAEFVDPVFAQPGLFDSTAHVWAVLAYAGQIYCDFSGYSDLAIACAKWFGFELPQNFNFPYLSGSIAEFWKRWHMSLSTWMRDYLYFPLGGSHRGVLRAYANLLITMTLCGFWHGASWNYVFWGAYNGVLLVIHRLYDRTLSGVAWIDRLRGAILFRVVAVATTFWLVALGLVLVRTESWSGCWLVESSMLGLGAYASPAQSVPMWVMLLVGMVAAGHLFGGLRRLTEGILSSPPLLRAATYVAAVALLVVFGPGVTKAFIYFQF